MGGISILSRWISVFAPYISIVWQDISIRDISANACWISVLVHCISVSAGMISVLVTYISIVWQDISKFVHHISAKERPQDISIQFMYHISANAGMISVLITIYQHIWQDISTGAPYISKRWQDISTYHYISACLAGYQYLSLYISMSGMISVLITIYQHRLARYQYSCTYISIRWQDISTGAPYISKRWHDIS
ncbi:hypothetical protein DTX80_14565, partial [Bacilli bacterium]